MKVKFSGKVLLANGLPLENVTVRIFDQDAPGKEDDDLTVTPGTSGVDGSFSLTYEPLRYLDFHSLASPASATEVFNQPEHAHGIRLPDLGDIYLPYLQFAYTFNGQSRLHTAPMGLFRDKFYLPELPPMEFLPSRDGFKFPNRFPGYFLPFSPPEFLRSNKVSSVYGLCGGMCAAVCDFALAGKPMTERTSVPRQGVALQRYLFQRQVDSLGALGAQVVKVAQWTSLPDDGLVGVQARTAQEFSQVRGKLDDKNPVVLALIYARSSSLAELSRLIFSNHQVLAYAYQAEADGTVTLQVYDPNLPGRDDVTLRCEPVVLGQVSTPTGSQAVMGFKTTHLVGGQFFRMVRGFFSLPYAPVKPPRRL